MDCELVVLKIYLPVVNSNYWSPNFLQRSYVRGRAYRASGKQTTCYISKQPILAAVLASSANIWLIQWLQIPSMKIKHIRAVVATANPYVVEIKIFTALLFSRAEYPLSPQSQCVSHMLSLSNLGKMIFPPGKVRKCLREDRVRVPTGDQGSMFFSLLHPIKHDYSGTTLAPLTSFSSSRLKFSVHFVSLVDRSARNAGCFSFRHTQMILNVETSIAKTTSMVRRSYWTLVGVGLGS
ncbi:hypothetical protein DL96DRAFT_324748 [Flagelloscypha sp. PMI_526]|nr:hypothetical protein DL96DRAFT_324748 [Flagelloscypha sp. PMI_526]